VPDFSDAIAQLEANRDQFASVLAGRLATRRREYRTLMAASLLQRYPLGVDAPIQTTAAELTAAADRHVEDLLPSISVDAFDAVLEILSQSGGQS
jgi:hypothetical protein